MASTQMNGPIDIQKELLQKQDDLIRIQAERDAARSARDWYEAAATDVRERMRAAEAERDTWKTRCISRGKENDELRDEIARLRRSFPVDALREYDRRKEAA